MGFFRSKNRDNAQNNNDATQEPPLAYAVAVEDIVPPPTILPVTGVRADGEAIPSVAVDPIEDTTENPYNKPYETKTNNNNNNNHHQSAKNDGDVVRNLGRNPVRMTCPICNQESATKVKTFPNWFTMVASGGLCYFCCPVFWVPCVLDCMKQSDHYCEKCAQKVGTVHPMMDCC